MYNPFTTEAWTEYAVGMVIIFSRITARCWQVGLNWDGDDYFTILCALFFTAELVMLELIGRYGSITGMSNEIALQGHFLQNPPSEKAFATHNDALFLLSCKLQCNLITHSCNEIALQLTTEQKQRIIVGSKCLLAGWILYTTLIWCLKACMLFFYRRLTLNLQQRNLVKITGAACIAAYIATIIVFLTHCHPIHRLWQVYPYPGDDCALNISKYLALVVTNVTTDLMILFIPLPLLWGVRLPFKRKLLYFFWLCTGIFIMTATLLRCILCLQDVSQINVGTIWSIRETFVGIIAVNAPILKPFFTQAKKAVSSGKPSHNSSGNGLPDSLRLSHVERKGKKRTVHDITNMDTMMNESEEHIISPAGRPRSEISSREERGDV